MNLNWKLTERIVAGAFVFVWALVLYLLTVVTNSIILGFRRIYRHCQPSPGFSSPGSTVLHAGGPAVFHVCPYRIRFSYRLTSFQFLPAHSPYCSPT